uniref:Uncharacterized protein n=1 Tax=Steinernema glaseri TaxID=37863 RepID=A0A1I7XZ58_9BILA
MLMQIVHQVTWRRLRGSTMEMNVAFVLSGDSPGNSDGSDNKDWALEKVIGQLIRVVVAIRSLKWVSS